MASEDFVVSDSPIPSMGSSTAGYTPPQSRGPNRLRTPNVSGLSEVQLDEECPSGQISSPTPLLGRQLQRAPPGSAEMSGVILPAVTFFVTGVSIFGFRQWAGSYTNPAGTLFTDFQFGGLIIHTYVTGFIAVPLLVWGMLSSKLVLDEWTRAIFHFAVALVLLVLGSCCLGYWGRFWDTAGVSSPTNDNGFVLATGLGLFAAAYSLAFVFVVLGARCLKPSLLRWNRSELSDVLMILGFLLVVLPFCFFLSCLLPNWAIAIFSVKDLYRTADPKIDSHDGSCGKFGTYYFCVYYDVLIWYAHIYVLCAIALASKYSQRVRRFLSQARYTSPMALRRLTGFRTTGEALLLLWFISLLVSSYFFWYGHDWEGGTSTLTNASRNLCVTNTDTGETTRLQQNARIFGQLSNLILSLLALPTARSSIWSKILGVSWEAMQQYHVFLGYSFMLCTALHQFLWWGFWSWQKKNLSDTVKIQCGQGSHASDVGGWPHDILAVPLEYHGDNFANPLIQIVWWTMILCMGVFALNRVRRSNFELFYYTHHAYFVIYIGALLHATSLWYFLISGLGLWFTDRLIRFGRGCSVVGGVSLTPYGTDTLRMTMVEINTIDGLAPVFEAGQYAFLNIPEISALQWHPFTIASAPSEGMLRFYIKAMGHGSWTESLYQLAGSAPHLGTVPLINVDAPYGLPFDWERCERVVLVLGGIGVTPGLSLIEELHHRRSQGLPCPQAASCLWALGSPEFIQTSGVGKQLERVRSSCRTKIHLTRRRSADKVELGTIPFSVGGRPDLSDFIASDEAEVAPENTVVFVCGPASMVTMARAASLEFGFQFHTETFEL